MSFPADRRDRLTAISCPFAADQRSFGVLVPLESCSCCVCRDCHDYSEHHADCEASHHFEKTMTNEKDSTCSSPVSGNHVSLCCYSTSRVSGKPVSPCCYPMSPVSENHAYHPDPVVAYPQYCDYPFFGPTKDAVRRVSTCLAVSLAGIGRASLQALSEVHSLLFPLDCGVSSFPLADAAVVFVRSRAPSSQANSPHPDKLEIPECLLLDVGGTEQASMLPWL